MATEKKVKIVEELQKTFDKTTVGIVTDYRGLTTAESNEIRKRLRAAKGEYKVVKNSLAQIAAKNAGMEHSADTLKGPVGLALGYGEAPAVAKAITEYIRGSKTTLSIKGGFLPDKVLSAREIESLAKLPSREILLSHVMAGLQSPIYGLVNVLAAPLRDMMGVLQARIKQLEAN